MIFPLLLALAASDATPLPAPVTQRMALVVSQNDGGHGRVKLQHADDDARAVAAVLTELGGVAPNDVVRVVDRGLAGVEAGLDELAARTSARMQAGARVEALIYYSGHSDSVGLLLGADRLPYDALLERLGRVEADVKITILDSCASGSVIREKGGRHLPPFLIDESARVAGTAVLTSSSRDEVAQESDALGSSYFTHALVSGLRGAADTSRDGRVTLQEAYRFAFDETLHKSETASGGAQHPMYEMRLSGTGDYVLTDLRSVAAGLLLDDGLQGRVSIRDDGGRLVVELQKQRGAPLLLGLPAGRYVVRTARADEVREGPVSLEEGKQVTVTASDLATLSVDAARSRGDAPIAFVPVNVALFPPVEVNAVVGRAENLFGFHIIAGHQAKLTGIDLALGMSWVDEEARGIMLGILGNVVGGDARGALIGVGGNVVAGDLVGAEVGVGANVVAGNATGALVGVGANVVAADAIGLELGVGANVVAGDFTGFQVAAGGNVTAGHVRGLSIAAGTNFAGGDAVGGQIAAGLNVGLGANRGAFVAPLNFHADVDGVQLGVINVARRVNGLELGVINVGDDVEGLQLGVINVARSAPFAFGVLNFIGDGVHEFGFFSSDVAPLGLRLALGGRHLYTAFHFGVTPFGDEGASATGLRVTGTGTGSVGARVPFEVLGARLHVDVEAGAGERARPIAQFFYRDESRLDLYTFGRVVVGWKPFEHLTIAAGPALNVFIADARAFDGTKLPLSVTYGDATGVQTTLSPGFAVYVGL